MHIRTLGQSPIYIKITGLVHLRVVHLELVNLAIQEAARILWQVHVVDALAEPINCGHGHILVRLPQLLVKESLNKITAVDHPRTLR